jgi:alpha-galactosidase
MNDDTLILAKPMEDGSLAVGLFNLAESEQTLRVTWNQLGLFGKQRVRDLWRHKDMGVVNEEYSVAIPRHAVMLVRMWPVQS